MGLLRTLEHLLPTGAPFKLLAKKSLTKFFAGLAPAGEDVQAAADLAYLDLFPDTTRELQEWEQQFGLSPAEDASEAQRRLLLAAEWKSTGGQSAEYIEGVLQTAGFNVYVHEWWASENPYVPRDPRDHVPPFSIGTVQCGSSIAICGHRKALCNDFPTRDPMYWATLTLSSAAPPPIPADPSKWPFFLYIGGKEFPETAEIPESRKAEFQRLVQKLKPTQQWIVVLVDYTVPYLLTEDGGRILTEDGGRFII